MSEFDQAFEKLMQKIANEAIEAPNLPDKVDAAKVLQPYYALRKKQKLPAVGAGTMDDLRNRIKGADKLTVAGGTDYDPDSAA